MRRATAGLLVLVGLACTGCGGSGSAPAPPGDFVAFTVTFRFDEDCAGVWAADSEGELDWLVGRGGRAGEPAAYPTFRHDGRLAAGFFRGSITGDLPPIDVVMIDDRRTVVAGADATPVAWSPTQTQLLALTRTADGGNDLVRVDDTGRRRKIAGDAGYQFAWLGDGDSVAYLAFRGEQLWLWTVSSAGDDARVLARGVERHLAASPDGRRIAFRRRAHGSLRHELWIVDVATGAQRRLRGRLLPDFHAFEDVWIDGDTLVVHDDRSGAGGEAPDAIRVEAESGARSLLSMDTRILQASRDGSLLLAAREPLLQVDEQALAVLTLRPDGTEERLVAVTDAGFIWGMGIPVLQPVQHALSPAVGAVPPPALERRCRSRLIALRERIEKG
jgi:hypothetical protein